jgi:hypothetical protein
MEPNHGPEGTSGEIGELIVLNGRQLGARKPLRAGLTLLGRAPSCDMRLNVDGVQPLHCALVYTPEGMTLRDLGGAGNTLVNAEPAIAQPLHDDDVLTVGPFSFRIRLPDDPRPAVRHLQREMELLGKEKEALRVQAAAVVAQQASLSETEARLEQRLTELKRQEEQLATHLEEKRARLLELQTQVREEREDVQVARAALTAREEELEEELSAGRKEFLEGRAALEKQRRRLTELRRRFKGRWHRMFDRERESLRRREQDLTSRQRAHESAASALQQARTGFLQTQLRHNGEVELNRRQLQAGWDELQQARRQWQEARSREEGELQRRRAEIGRREAAVLKCARSQADEQREWEERKAGLERELEGLNNRVRNQRRKVVDQERDLARLGELLRRAQRGVAPSPEPVLAVEPGDLPAPDATESGLSPERFAAVLPLDEGLGELERLADVVAGQKLQLAEQCRQLHDLQQRWHHEHHAAVDDLERMGVRLLQREQELDAREQGLEALAVTVQQRFDQAADQRQHLEGWQARLAAREASWPAERERLLAAVQAREDAASQQIQIVSGLRQRWSEERARESREVQAAHERCQNLREQYVALWEDYFQKNAALEQHQRALGEKALALEQYRLEVIGQAENSVVAERRMDQLRAQLTALTAASERRLADERAKLEAEASRLHDLSRRLQHQAGELARREEELERRLQEWEHEQGLEEVTQTRLRQELQTLQAQRDSYERQLSALNQELERLARTLLDESEPPTILLGRAA